eukprot:SAG31_NODE_6185_length_2132_cov_2.190851_2_plen_163_part_00
MQVKYSVESSAGYYTRDKVTAVARAVFQQRDHNRNGLWNGTVASPLTAQDSCRPCLQHRGRCPRTDLEPDPLHAAAQSGFEVRGARPLAQPTVDPSPPLPVRAAKAIASATGAAIVGDPGNMLADARVAHAPVASCLHSAVPLMQMVIAAYGTPEKARGGTV